MNLSKPKKPNLLLPALLPPAVLGVMLLLKATPFGLQLENLSENWRFQWRGPSDPPPDPRIIVAGIGDYSLAKAGRWGDWTRDIHAGVCQSLTLKPPKALVFDLFFSEPSRDPSQDQAFADALALHPGAVTGAIADQDSVFQESFSGASIGKTEPIQKVSGDRSPLLSAAGGTLPIEEISVSAWTGFVNAPPSSVDGLRRSIPVVVNFNGQIYPSLALQAVLQMEEVTTEDVEVRVGEAVLVTKDNRLLHRIPIDGRGCMRINYRKTSSFELCDYIRVGELLENYARTGQWPPEGAPQTEGRIMIVGQTAEGLADFGPTPFKAIEPNVFIHANALNTILRGDYLHETGWTALGAGWLLLAWLSLWGLHRAGIAKAIAIPIILTAVFIILVFLAFQYFSVSVPLVLPVAGFAGIHSLAIVRRLVEESRSRRQIRNLLGAYISVELVQKIIDSGIEPGLGGEKKVITAFFSDIQNFSTLSEELSPDQLMTVMITYLTGMTDTMLNQGGLLDKYVGDAVVGMFGALLSADHHAYQAVSAAIAMQKRQELLREQWRGEGIWPESVCQMRTRIGLNTGEAIVGNMGSSRRFNYTMLGDAVNIAARCESGAKTYGVQTMITGETRAAAIAFRDDVVYRQIDRIVVKGRVAPVDIYEVAGFKNDVPREFMECLRLYAEGLNAYFERRWDEAASCFAQSAQVEALQPGLHWGIKTNPSLLMLQRVNEMKINPPKAGWNGAYVMESK